MSKKREEIFAEVVRISRIAESVLATARGEGADGEKVVGGTWESSHQGVSSGPKKSHSSPGGGEKGALFFLHWHSLHQRNKVINI